MRAFCFSLPLVLLGLSCGSGGGPMAPGNGADPPAPPGPPVSITEVHVSTTDQLRQAVRQAGPGTHILIAPGEYQGGGWVGGIQGTAQSPIIIAGADPANPPVIRGGGQAYQLSDVAYLEIRDIVVIGASQNGLNIDDGGTYDTPAHHIRLRRVTVRDIGPSGNRDGIKLSGVQDFRVEDCLIERWGDGGSGIDMVGCHRGIIERCVFRHGDGTGADGVQAKGGSREIAIRRNRFEHAGSRGVNIGGSTGLEYFRPAPQGYEAKEILVEGNIFIGSLAPLAFVGVDGSIARFNTIYRPARWAIRILQETNEPGFVPCRNGVLEDNIVVFRSEAWAEGGVNIGPATAPETFRFARNVWYCEDRPELSRPTLPTAETGGLVGEDPRFVDTAGGDFTLQPGSPATGRGHTGLVEP